MNLSRKVDQLKHFKFWRFVSSGPNTEYGLEKKWAYYDQDFVDREAAKPLHKLTPTQIMFHGKFADGSHLVKSAHYLQQELPRRIARHIKDFQSLPYVVLINPIMQEVYELYLRAFRKLVHVTEIDNLEKERQYSFLLSQLLNDHKDVVTYLAKAFRQVKKFVPYEVLGDLAERTLTSRLGIRLLAEHHLALRHKKEHFIGIIGTQTSLKHIIERCVINCKDLCQHRFGYSPAVYVSGHTKATFPYIPAPVEYIMQELIKNSMRATVVRHIENPFEMPPIEVTICNNDEYFTIKISDKGGGIPDSQLSDIFQYSFTTSTDNEGNLCETEDTFDNFSRAANDKGIGGVLSGYGFGLPSAAAYAKFLGGSLTLVSMYGLGTDVFLKLIHINQPNCFRI
ncbi:branched-chain alpha-ketoacid dehydrogenase kinase isoform X2 [Hydra vulgaris]|uniref:Protein-serine/threonine kinase n=1 Tax=Hydra vulgaris TaxID=6087 RepID=A0ABM4CR25_HYDVU